MKLYKNFDEIREKFEKPTRKYYENFLNWSVLNICWNFEKICYF